MQIVRLANHPEHIAELARLHFDEWGWLRPGQTLAERTEKLRSCCGHDGLPMFLIAIDAAGLVGSAAIHKYDMETRKDLTPWLGSVYVKTEHRQKGVATALIRRIEIEASGMGVDRLYLFTPSAEGFYKRIGWTLMNRCDYMGEAVSIMTKSDLTAPDEHR